VAGAVAAVSSGACHPAPATCKSQRTFAATGFFRTDSDGCGRSWLVTPGGARFYSLGVNHVSYQGDFAPATNSSPYGAAVQAKYGSETAWASAESQRLASWGWNTIGAWSSNDTLASTGPYTLILGLSGVDQQTGAGPDYFSIDWENSVESGVTAGTAGHVSDPNLLGYFLDNELNWGPDWRTPLTLFDQYFALDASAPGKLALIALLQTQHHGDISDFNTEWSTNFTSWSDLASATALPSGIGGPDRSAFLEEVARRYFAVTTGSVRAYDANHLILGSRFVSGLIPVEVATAAGDYLDVISVNAYEYAIPLTSLWPPRQFGFVDIDVDPWLSGFYATAHKPVLVSEFGFRAADAGLPSNDPPVFPTLATQQDRADRFEAYAQKCFAAPYIVGYQWFEWADEPATGRFDGENSNWGLVNANDVPYLPVVERTTSVNAEPATW
jgi:hypothetical protein